MQQLPPPTIDLPETAFREVSEHRKMGCFRFALYCMRHPIYAFMAYQAVNPDPPGSKARNDAMFLAAIAHGFMAWLLLSR
jgi:hypothetical protein